MEPAKIRRSYVNGPYGQIHLRISGAGRAKRPLVCFHPSLFSGAMYEAWLGEMGKDRFVVAPDTPGYGMSDHPPAAPSIRDYADAMEEVLDALDLPEVDLMGYHGGAKIAAELARMRPRRVKHLVLVSAPVYTPEELAQQRTDRAAPDPTEDGSHLLAQWRTLWQFRGPGQTADTMMRYFPEVLRGGARRDWGAAAALSYAYPGVIDQVKAPILVLNPNDDLTAFTPRILGHLSNGRVLDLPQWGYGFLDAHTGAAAQFLRPFLDEDRWPDGAHGA